LLAIPLALAFCLCATRRRPRKDATPSLAEEEAEAEAERLQPADSSNQLKGAAAGTTPRGCAGHLAEQQADNDDGKTVALEQYEATEQQPLTRPRYDGYARRADAALVAVEECAAAAAAAASQRVGPNAGHTAADRTAATAADALLGRARGDGSFGSSRNGSASGGRQSSASAVLNKYNSIRKRLPEGVTQIEQTMELHSLVRAALAFSCGLKSGQRVQVRGLKSMSELNGKMGCISTYSSALGRYEVCLDGDSSKVSIKPANLLPLVRGCELTGIHEQGHLNGLAAELYAFDEVSGRYKVRLEKKIGHRMLLRRKNIVLPPGTPLQLDARLVKTLVQPPAGAKPQSPPELRQQQLLWTIVGIDKAAAKYAVSASDAGVGGPAYTEGLVPNIVPANPIWLAMEHATL